MTLAAAPVAPGRERIANAPLWTDGVRRIASGIPVDDLTRARASAEIVLPP